MSSNPLHTLWEEESTMEELGWLTTMIVRECKDADIDKVYETIEKPGNLVTKNEQACNEYLERCREKSSMCNPDERGSSEMPYCNNFGFWLPHGLGNGSDDHLAKGIRDCITSFNAIERASGRYFGMIDDLLPIKEE
jgi:hypothetical protein